MSAHTPHQLHDVFPHDAKTLQMLKLGDMHFCNLAGRYHAVNRAIHRIDCEVDRCSNAFAERLKRQRLRLLDEIAAILEKADARTVFA